MFIKPELLVGGAILAMIPLTAFFCIRAFQSIEKNEQTVITLASSIVLAMLIGLLIGYGLGQLMLLRS